MGVCKLQINDCKYSQLLDKKMLLSLLIIILTVTSHWYNQQLLLSIFPAIIRLNKQHYLSILLKDSQIVEAKCCFFGQQAAGVQKGWMQWCHYPLGVNSRDISKERDSMITTMHKEARKLVSMSTVCVDKLTIYGKFPSVPFCVTKLKPSIILPLVVWTICLLTRLW